jgi:hypothetical protein
MNRSKGRGKLGLGLSAFAELSSAPPTPTAIRSPRKRADMRMRQRTSTLSSESSDLDTVGDGLAPATPDGSAARDRRPSLTAPAAAQDLEASVLSFMAAITTDPYSLSEAASTDTLDFFSEGADKREQEEEEEEEEEEEAVEVEAGVRDKDEEDENRESDDEDGISVLSEYTFQHTASSTLFPRVATTEPITLVASSRAVLPAHVGLQVHLLSDDFMVAPNMLSALSITPLSSFPEECEDLASPFSVREADTEEAPGVFPGEKDRRRRSSVAKTQSIDYDDDDDDMSMLSYDTMYSATSTRSRVKSIPRQPIKQPSKPVAVYGVNSSNATNLRSIIRQATRNHKPSTAQQKWQQTTAQQQQMLNKRNSSTERK